MTLFLSSKRRLIFKGQSRKCNHFYEIIIFMLNVKYQVDISIVLSFNIKSGHSIPTTV